MYEFGDKLGFAFQLLDDVNDYFISNKGWGNDLRDFKKTPILYLATQKNPSLVETKEQQTSIFLLKNIIHIKIHYG